MLVDGSRHSRDRKIPAVRLCAMRTSRVVTPTSQNQIRGHVSQNFCRHTFQDGQSVFVARYSANTRSGAAGIQRTSITESHGFYRYTPKRLVIALAISPRHPVTFLVAVVVIWSMSQAPAVVSGQNLVDFSYSSFSQRRTGIIISVVSIAIGACVPDSPAAPVQTSPGKSLK